MSDERVGRRSLESLKKEAKRWLDALRAGDPDARARFQRALPDGPAAPTLRDVQLALAREYGFSGWSALRDAIETDAEPASLEQYDRMVDVLLDAYRSGTPDAMERLYEYTWHRRTWQVMRTYVQLDLGKRPTEPGADVALTVDDARFIIAKDHGFENWNALRTFLATTPPSSRIAARPVRLYDPTAFDEPPVLTSRDWNAIIAELRGHPDLRLNAEGQMTDDLLADLARLETITSLDLGGSKALTDEGLRKLAGLPHLRHLNLWGTAITDAGLSVLSTLPALESVSLGMTRITDAGARALAGCDRLETVDLSWTHTGDSALRALAGKERLREFKSGTGLTDAGIPLLHELPVFKSWKGGEPWMALLSYDARPNQLVLRGQFTDRGMQELRGLDGLFGLNIDDSNLAITAASLPPLASLPHLGWLAVDARDDWMSHIADMPHLRFLGAQDTVASDDGFVALSRSQSIEVIWGRRCHNLQRRGFVALSKMPKLRGLSVSCLNVDDEGISMLPSFPALRELMPMDVPDAGYRHIGKCTELESLVLMYCRDTTDAATEHITGLSKLSYYFNSYTTITDRTPGLLSTMNSLERVTFDSCHNLTDAGVAKLATLPRLRRVDVSGRGVSGELVSGFPASVRVTVWS